MSNNATPERPTPPRPVHMSLPSAVSTALASGTMLEEMNLSRWAASFDTSEEAVRVEFEKQLWVKTQHPVDDFGGEGK